MIAACVGFGTSRLTEHVVRIGIALRLKFSGPTTGLFDRGSEYKVPPQFFHCLGYSRAYQGFAHALDQALQGLLQAFFIGSRDYLSGQQ